MFLPVLVLLGVALVTLPVQGQQKCGVSKNNFSDDGNHQLRKRESSDGAGNFTLKAGDMPWIATIYFIEKGEMKLACAGTLVSPTTVITAAHCVILGGETLSHSEIAIAFGQSSKDFGELIPKDAFIPVKQILVAEKYLGQSVNHADDLAVIELSQPVTLSESVQPACLNLSSTPILDDTPIYALCSQSIEDGRHSDLRWSRHKYLNWAACKDKLHSQSLRFLSNDKSCFSQQNDECQFQGLSGGPVTVEHAGIHTVVGIVSTKFSDKGGSYIVGMTNLKAPQHREWLSSILV